MIAIKGMEMPANCFDCCLTASECTVSMFRKDRRADGCPLVEIVTCKDCKYARQNNDNDRYCYLSGKYHDIDYYCANGKIKE